MRAKHAVAVQTVDGPVAVSVSTSSQIGLAQVASVGAARDVTLRVSGQVVDAVVDPSVDLRLLQEAMASGARVVFEQGNPLCVVGLLCTQRALTIDDNNRVVAKLSSVLLDVEEQLLLRTPLSFLQMSKDGEVEVFGQRLISRARKLAKILAAHISLN